MYNYLIIFCFTLFYTSVFYPRNFSQNVEGFNGSDLFGFTAMPAGQRAEGKGNFNNIGTYAYFWTCDEFTDNPEKAYRRVLQAKYETIANSVISKLAGYSVRCVKDSE